MEHPEPIGRSMIYVRNYKLNGEDNDEWQCQATFSPAIQRLVKYCFVKKKDLIMCDKGLIRQKDITMAEKGLTLNKKLKHYDLPSGQ